MDNILDRILELKPYFTDWPVTSTDVITMSKIVGGIVTNQASCGKWLISEAIVDTVRVYIYCSGDELDEVLKAGLGHMVEEHNSSGEARQI